MSKKNKLDNGKISYCKTSKKADALYKNIEIFELLDADNVNIVKMHFDVIGEKNFFVPEPMVEDSLDFCYILSGEVLFHDKSIIAREGDFFYVNNLKKIIEYTILRPCDMLYVSFNDKNYAERIQGYNVLEESILKCLEKDAYTYGHNLRVKEYSIAIGKKVGIQAHDLEALALASQYHDIGKIEIDDSILFKESKLTDLEYECIKRHTEYGYEITKNFVDNRICLAIKQHHERLDGSGYPDKLKEDDICIMARIIAVADSYDAMTTDRPYRKGFTPQKAIEELKQFSGKHYSIECVAALEKSLIEKGLL